MAITLEAHTEFDLSALKKISQEINNKIEDLSHHFRITSYKVYTLKSTTPEEVLNLLGTLEGELFYFRTIVYIDKKHGMVTGAINRNSGYLNLRLRFLAKDVTSINNLKKAINALFKEKLIKQEDRVIPIQWYFSKESGDIDYNIITDMFNENIMQDAYPYLKNIYQYVDDFIHEQEANILILLGPPGTGKTRLIRYIVQKIDEYKRKLRATDVAFSEYDDESSPIYVLYTTDTHVLKKEEIFIEFLSEDDAVLVLEDIDLYLKDRKTSHNEVMHKFLASSSGFIQNRGRKIIISTNLPVQDIDDALLRPGRAFGKIQTRHLIPEEAKALLKSMGYAELADKLEDKKDFPLSELYQLINKFKHK